jgi:hypothetical protein
MPPDGTSRRKILSGIAGLSLAAAAPPNDALRVSVADFGVIPGVNDAGPGLRAAIARLGRRAGSTLYFPPGTYRFAARDGVAMLFDDMDRLTLEGDGATLLFNGVVAPVLMRHCRSPVLKGLTFDWERPPFSQGEVTEVGADGRSVTLRVDPEFPVDGSEKFQELGTYDRRTRAMTFHGIDPIGAVASVSLIGPQLLRLTLRNPLPLKPGDTLVARHRDGPPVIALESCQDFSINDVAIYAGPAMGITAGGCNGGSLRGVRVEPKPGTGRLMSTDADAFHCGSCSGDLTVTDCKFSGMGDDAINVTGLYLGVEPDRDRRRLTLTGGRFPREPIWAAPRIGDHLLLVSGLTLKPITDVQVQDLDGTGAGRWSVMLPTDHPAFSSEPVFAIDLQARTKLLVSRCSFPGHHGRGVLAHSDAVIEHCVFTRQSHPAVLLAPDMYWQEGPAIERTVVRDNQMHDVNLLGRFPGAVWIGAFVSPGGHRETPTPDVVNQNVVVNQNNFVRPNGAAVAAAATRDLRIEDNRIEQASLVAFSLQNVRAVRLQGNRCDPAASIRVDPASRRELTLSHNIGLRVA